MAGRYIYEEKFPKGTTVRIANRQTLENFMHTWKYHHKLQPEQLQYADRVTEVESVGFYHGGNVIYKLHAIPGIWHEVCLETV